MASRFDLLEERLNQLDDVALLEGKKGAERSEAGVAAIPPLPRQGLAALRTKFIQECRAELAALAASVEAESELRMKSKAEEIVVRLLGDINAALEKSAGVIASQAIQLVEEEIKLAARRTFEAETAGQSERAGIKQTVSASPNGPVPGTPPGAEVTLPGALEALQRNSGAFLNQFDAQLRATLHAFEENTARQLAANFQKVVREFLELEAGRAYDKKPAVQANKHEKTGGSPGQQSIAVAALERGERTERSETAPAGQASPQSPPAAAEKPAQMPKKKDASWRILGLS